MCGFLTNAVSVKSKTGIWIKADLLFFRRRRNNTRAREIRPLRRGISPSNAKSIERWEMKMQAIKVDVQGRLLALVSSILDQNAIVADLDPRTLLVDVGLTSMDMVNLMLAVEAEFDFTIPQSEITPENFQSVETLSRLVVSQLAPATAA
jgi:acyl carrier protein